ENAALFASAANPTPYLKLPALDVDKAFQEDAQQPEQSRFAAPLAPVDISPAAQGRWYELPGGDRVWRCAIQSPKALGLLLVFDQFVLPEGGRFFAYDVAKSRVFGAYTARSCVASGKFIIGLVPGDAVMLEYVEPAAVAGPAQIHLNRVDYVYDPAGMLPANSSPDDFGQSLGCNVNINCPDGQSWQTEKKGVARILMTFSNGAGWCTGTLVANTSGSGDPYLLTAHHCQLIGLTPDFDTWRFDFDYEAPSCANPGTEPVPKSVLGCQRIAYRADTDFMLLKTNPIPQNFGVYFNGWNRTAATNTLVTKSTFIHHPAGDIKKISIDNEAATIYTQTVNWGGVFGTSPANSHWRVGPDIGIYQPGSSGSALFDQNKRIVGQLHGGNADQNNACLILNSYFGRFDISWEQGPTSETRLKEWLDPTNTNAFTQNGYAQPAPTTVSIAGNIQTHWGAAMANVLVKLSGGATATTRTSAAGNFTFANLASGLNYTVTPERDTNDVNGVSTIDLSVINKHVLGLELLDSPWKILAADANGSKSVTTIDIVEARKILLGLNTAFPSVASWRFFPTITTFPDPTNPFSGFPGGPPPEFLQFSNLLQNVTDANFKGVKIGDMNNNAKPGG
ncbi:MAG: hypothetical protein IT260_01985, partial [Saprospiraceae bacterium]|nr:hypothetical protein [Saprospiraceae bacterium]